MFLVSHFRTTPSTSVGINRLRQIEGESDLLTLQPHIGLDQREHHPGFRARELQSVTAGSHHIEDGANLPAAKRCANLVEHLEVLAEEAEIDPNPRTVRAIRLLAEVRGHASICVEVSSDVRDVKLHQST